MNLFERGYLENNPRQTQSYLFLPAEMFTPIEISRIRVRLSLLRVAAKQLPFMGKRTSTTHCVGFFNRLRYRYMIEPNGITRVSRQSGPSGSAGIRGQNGMQNDEFVYPVRDMMLVEKTHTQQHRPDPLPAFRRKASLTIDVAFLVWNMGYRGFLRGDRVFYREMHS